MGPIIAITFNPNADAMCINAESFVTNTLHRFIMAMLCKNLSVLITNDLSEFIFELIDDFNSSSSGPPNKNILAFFSLIKFFAKL